MDQWLVRTSRNRITGPFPRDHVLHMIKKGELTAEDEVCLANHYWFYLHEDEEVFSQLGIEIASAPVVPTTLDDDVTVTQTQAVEQDEDFEEDTDGGNDADLADIDLPELADRLESAVDETAMITNRALREFQPKKKGGTGSLGGLTASRTPVDLVRVQKESVHYRPVVLGKIEKVSFWRGFAMAMAGVVFFLVGIVVYILRKG
ncbi:MAG: hypothetical protein AABZ55_04690 [Bdellovibrionota bacterium]